MKYVATNYLGTTPARSYQKEKIVCVNLETFFLMPEEIRRFIVLHEIGHIVRNTDSETEADKYAFNRMTGTTDQANRWSILALSRVLPFTTKEQYLRLLNMYKMALETENDPVVLRENYELTGTPAYEYDNIQMMIAEAEQMPDDSFQMETGAAGTPIGPYADIAHAVWLKAALGMPLTGYEQSILDKYPMPEDFQAYDLDGEELLGEAANAGTELSGSLKNWYSSLSSNAVFWFWVVIAVLLMYFVSKTSSK